MDIDAQEVWKKLYKRNLKDDFMVRTKEMFIRLCGEYLANPESSAALSTSDWECFMEMANRHGICPLLYYHLAKSGKHIPHHFSEHLKEQYHMNTLRNEYFYDELSKILETLRKENIEVIVMKGAVLAEIIYPERGLRPFSDIDLLIRRESLNKAEDTLIRLGYTLDIRATPHDFSKRYDYHLRYIKGTSIIELHWDLGLRTGIFKYMMFKTETIWKDAIRSRIAGIDTLIPSPEDLIIYSCIHSAKHKYSRLIWLYDIRQIAEHHRIDWDHLIRNTKSRRTSRSIFYGLQLTEELLWLNIPKHALDELRPPAYEVSIFRFILSWESLSILNAPKDLIMRLLLIDRTVDRMKLIITYPFESFSYILFGNKKRIFRRLKENAIGL